MSHEHRDEGQLADRDLVEPEPIVVPSPAPAVANSEAERRAAERRKAQGVPEQTTEHQFTGDLPEASRGGTDTETRIVLQHGAPNDDPLATQAGAARRGPPPPRALQLADEHSWAAPPALDALATGTTTDTALWLRNSTPEAARIASDLDAPGGRMWTKLPG